MIVLMDLDDTLVDRDLAFTTWAGRFIADAGGQPEDLDWLLAVDDHGTAGREDLAAALKRRLDLDASVPELVDGMRLGIVQHIQVYADVPAALCALTAAGTVVVVVTNGSVAQQTRKLRATGLVDLVHDVVVSEAVGARKPDPSIFRAALAAAARHGGSGPAWMVGDHPRADISGAQACGLHTGWVSHDRAWGAGSSPDITAPAAADVLTEIARAHST